MAFCPTSATQRAPVSRSKLNRHGLRTPRTWISGRPPPAGEAVVGRDGVGLGRGWRPPGRSGGSCRAGTSLSCALSVRVAAPATVADADVQVAVGAEHELATVVVGVLLVVDRQTAGRAWPGRSSPPAPPAARGAVRRRPSGRRPGRRRPRCRRCVRCGRRRGCGRRSRRRCPSRPRSPSVLVIGEMSSTAPGRRVMPVCLVSPLEPLRVLFTVADPHPPGPLGDPELVASRARDHRGGLVEPVRDHRIEPNGGAFDGSGTGARVDRGGRGRRRRSRIRGARRSGRILLGARARRAEEHHQRQHDGRGSDPNRSVMGGHARHGSSEATDRQRGGRSRPSWTTVTASLPSLVNTDPVAKPRPPVADGVSWA